MKISVAPPSISMWTPKRRSQGMSILCGRLKDGSISSTLEIIECDYLMRLNFQALSVLSVHCGADDQPDL